MKQQREADWRRMRWLRRVFTLALVAVAATPIGIFCTHAVDRWPQEVLGDNANDIATGVGIAAAAIPVVWLTRNTYDLAGGMAALASAVAGLGADRVWASILMGTPWAFEPMSLSQRIVLVVAFGGLSMIIVFTGNHVKKRQEAKARALEAEQCASLRKQVRRDRENELFDELAHRQNVFMHASFPSFVVVFSVVSLIVFVSV